MRIAVIGSGVSGLTAALSIAARAEVTLYESAGYLGGHANTVDVQTPRGTVSVDTGFMVFNPPRYPIFVDILEYLGISAVPTDMSFSVSMPGEVEYASYGLRGLFAEPLNIIRPSHYSFILEILRFGRDARASLKQGLEENVTLGSYISKNAYSQKLTRHYLYPMLAAIWSCPASQIVGFPAVSTFRFMDNHRLLEPLSAADWQTIPGGSRSYVQAVERKLIEKGVSIRKNARISAVRRNEPIRIEMEDGKIEAFDHVILATHADTALSLLDLPSLRERDILGSFRYSKNRAVLHCDQSYMPSRPNAWASWNYLAEGTESDHRLSVTYDMNALQHIDRASPVYVTLNPARAIPDSNIYGVFEYEHPVFDMKCLQAQRRLSEIQNADRVAFAGAHWGYGFHEDGARSGIEAAKSLGF